MELISQRMVGRQHFNFKLGNDAGGGGGGDANGSLSFELAQFHPAHIQ
jgi:hypothetical protein